jgi:predicted nucleic acid-binding protein
MRYLVDTNIWLERLLDQEKSEVISQFLDIIPLHDLFVSDFSIHSIGVILSRYKKFLVFSKFLDDLFVNGQIGQLSLNPHELMQVISNMQEFNLDFDDVYQLSVSQKYDLVIVTFDRDFNSKEIQKTTPEQLIKQYGSTEWNFDMPT